MSFLSKINTYLHKLSIYNQFINSYLIYIMGSRTSKDFAYVFKKCPELTESMISYAFMTIGTSIKRLNI